VKVTPVIDSTLQLGQNEALPGERVPWRLNMTYPTARIEIGAGFFFKPSKRMSSVKVWWLELASRNRKGRWHREICAAPPATSRFRKRVPQGCAGTAVWSGRSPVGMRSRSRGSKLKLSFTGVSPAGDLIQLRDRRATKSIRLTLNLLGSDRKSKRKVVTSSDAVLLERQFRGAAVDTGSGSAQVYGIGTTESNDIASLAPGAAASASGFVDTPGVAVKGSEEPEADYLDRLQNAETGFSATATTVFARATRSGPAGAALQRVLPVIKIEKGGPVEFDPGDSLNYEISVFNSGHAAGSPLTLDSVESDAPVAVSSSAPLVAGASRTGVVNWIVPNTSVPAQVRDVATVTWTDGIGNQYGPVASRFTSLNRSASELPAPTITGGPPAQTVSGTARFEFDGAAGSSFECRIDGETWEECGSPEAVDGVSEGEHKFEVRQHLDGTRHSQPAGWSWKVDPDAQMCTGASTESEIWGDGDSSDGGEG
jgi:hypothetical protein